MYLWMNLIWFIQKTHFRTMWCSQNCNYVIALPARQRGKNFPNRLFNCKPSVEFASFKDGLSLSDSSVHSLLNATFAWTPCIFLFCATLELIMENNSPIHQEKVVIIVRKVRRFRVRSKLLVGVYSLSYFISCILSLLFCSNTCRWIPLRYQ